MKTMAEVIHTTHCLERVHGEHCMFWAEDNQSAAALSAAGFGQMETNGQKVKRFRGELRSLSKHLDSWTSEGHTTVTIRYLRNWVKARTEEVS